MQIASYSHKQINPSDWDDFVRKRKGGSVYSLYNSLMLLCDDWGAFIISDGNDWKAVWPFQIGAKAFVKYSYPPMFTQYLGLIGNVNPAEERQLARALKKKFKSIVASSSPEIKLSPVWEELGYGIRERLSYQLELNATEAELESSLRTNHKRNIKKAQNQGFSLSDEIQVEDAIEFFKSNKGDDIEVLQSKHYSYYKAWLSYLEQQSDLHILGARDNGGDLAGIKIIIDYQRNSIYSAGAVRKDLKSSGLSAMMLWESIKRSKKRGNAIFDFEGSMVEGIANFFAGFGGGKVFFQEVSFDHWLAKKLRKGN